MNIVSPLSLVLSQAAIAMILHLHTFDNLVMGWLENDIFAPVM